MEHPDKYFNTDIKASNANSQKTIALSGFAIVLASATILQSWAQEADPLIPAEQTAEYISSTGQQAPRFSWGDPILEGTYTSRDMSGIPMERPAQFGTRELLTAEEYRQRVTAGPGGIAALRAGEEFEGETRLQLSALDSSEVGTRTFGYTSYIIEPADGQYPALTEEGIRRQNDSSRGQANGPFFTTGDFSYYDRCITRGVTGSILPSLYGDAMRIVQSPTEVAITYEMLHDTRIIYLDGRPFPDSEIKQYMGVSRGHFEGDTLVVETRNLTEKIAHGRMIHSADAILTERITRVDPDMIDYRVTIDDPRTFESHWTFRVMLTTQPDYEVLEYSCHEGNFFVANALRAEKRYQQSVDQARANGEPIPERNISDGGLDIYQAPSSAEAIDINSGQ